MVQSKKPQSFTNGSIIYWLWRGKDIPPLKLQTIQDSQLQSQHNSQSTQSAQSAQSAQSVNYHVWISANQQLLSSHIPENISAKTQKDIVQNSFQLSDNVIASLYWQNIVFHETAYTLGIEEDLIDFLLLSQNKNHNNQRNVINVPWITWITWISSIFNNLNHLNHSQDGIYEQLESPFVCIKQNQTYCLISKEDYATTQVYWEHKIHEQGFFHETCHDFQEETQIFKTQFVSSSLNNASILGITFNKKRRLFIEKKGIQRILNRFNLSNIFDIFTSEKWQQERKVWQESINTINDMLKKPLLWLLVCQMIFAGLLYVSNKTYNTNTSNDSRSLNIKHSGSYQAKKPNVSLNDLLIFLQEQKDLNSQEVVKITCHTEKKSCTLYFSNQVHLTHYKNKIESLITNNPKSLRLLSIEQIEFEML